MSGVKDTAVLMASYEDKTSQGKGGIFDSSTVHVCSQKEMFNSLVVKEEGIIKIVDGSACKIIDTGRVKVTERDGTVRVLETVRYVPEARYNLISIGVLDEGCWGRSTKKDQVQQDVITVNQGYRVYLEGEV